MSVANPFLSRWSWLRLFLVVLVVLWLAVPAVREALSEEPFGVVRDQSAAGQIRLRDFTSHTRFVRGVCSGDWRQAEPLPSSAYSPAAHRRMMEYWLGPPQKQVLPFAYSPTMVWLTAPFAFLPDRAAYLVWTAIGLLLVGWMLSVRDAPWLVGVLLFVSYVAIWAVYHGQTAIFSTAAFLVLFRCSTLSPTPARFALAALTLWALTAKPPLAITAGAALLAARCWGPVLAAMALAAVTTALAIPWLGAAWAHDYITLVRSYNSEQADPTFAWCLTPTYMSNLRALLYQLGVGDALASQVSTLLWVVSQVAIALAGWLRKLSVPAVWALSILALLLFSPHANLTEELHLYVGAVAAAMLVEDRARTIERLLPLLFAAVFWLGCLLKAGSPWLYPAPAFIGKVVLAGLLVWIACRSRPGEVSGERK